MTKPKTKAKPTTAAEKKPGTLLTPTKEIMRLIRECDEVHVRFMNMDWPTPKARLPDRIREYAGWVVRIEEKANRKILTLLNAE